MILKSILLSSLVLFSLFNSAYASVHSNLTLKTSKPEALADPYFQVKSVKIKKLSPQESIELNLNSLEFFPPLSGPIEGLVPTPGGADGGLGIGGVISVIDQLIAIGEKVIAIIKQGAPVVSNAPMSAVSVLPRIDTKDPAVHDMGGWSIPKASHYKVTFQNGFGSDVVSFVYSINYQYNGNLDGKGKYLAGIRASATNIAVSWGFDLDASSQLLQISNIGTKENVIAGATIEMSYTVKNWTRNITTSNSYFISGDGKLYPLD